MVPHKVTPISVYWPGTKAFKITWSATHSDNNSNSKDIISVFSQTSPHLLDDRFDVLYDYLINH